MKPKLDPTVFEDEIRTATGRVVREDHLFPHAEMDQMSRDPSYLDHRMDPGAGISAEEYTIAASLPSCERSPDEAMIAREELRRIASSDEFLKLPAMQIIAVRDLAEELFEGRDEDNPFKEV